MARIALFLSALAIASLSALPVDAGPARGTQGPAAKTARNTPRVGVRARLEKARVKVETRLLGAERAEVNRVTRQERRTQAALGRALRTARWKMNSLYNKADTVGAELPDLVLGTYSDGGEVRITSRGRLLDWHDIPHRANPTYFSRTIGREARDLLPDLTAADVRHALAAWSRNANQLIRDAAAARPRHD